MAITGGTPLPSFAEGSMLDKIELKSRRDKVEWGSYSCNSSNHLSPFLHILVKARFVAFESRRFLIGSLKISSREDEASPVF